MRTILNTRNFLPVVLSILLASCSPRLVKSLHPIQRGQGYTVWQDTDSHKYWIHADSAKRAEEVARDIMGCRYRACVIQSNGVIFLLEQFGK